eukprot:tig00000145_g8840.t1
MVEYMAARGQEAGEGAAGSSAGGRLEAPEGRMHGSLRDEAHYHQWGRGNRGAAATGGPALRRHAHTLDVPPGLWVLFFADSEAHVRALAPIAAELARRYPPARAPTGGREPWDVWYRRPGAGTSQGHDSARTNAAADPGRTSESPPFNSSEYTFSLSNRGVHSPQCCELCVASMVIC